MGDQAGQGRSMMEGGMGSGMMGGGQGGFVLRGQEAGQPQEPLGGRVRAVHLEVAARQSCDFEEARGDSELLPAADRPRRVDSQYQLADLLSHTAWHVDACRQVSTIWFAIRAVVFACTSILNELTQCLAPVDLRL